MILGIKNRDEILNLILNRFRSDFARECSSRVLAIDGGVESVFELMVADNSQFSLAKQKEICFRSAYVLDYIYFNYPSNFAPLQERFIEYFPSCTNPSAQCHFLKIMADILKHHTPSKAQIELIATATAKWISHPKCKIAVKVWAMNILSTLRPSVEWIDEMWDDIEIMVMADASPAILVRKRRGWI